MDFSKIIVVFGYGMLTALATGLGALPLLLVRKKAHRFLGFGQVIAAALMTVASFMLLDESMARDSWSPAVGIVAGFILIMLANRLSSLFPRMSNLMQSENDDGAHKIFLIVFAMTLHSAAEGIGIGVSFGGGDYLGKLISWTIALHNIPEGLAISLIAVPRGMSVGKAGLWSIFSSLPQPAIGVLAFMFVTVFEPFLSFGLGLAAGAMFWMVIHELIPEARKSLKVNQVVYTFSITCLLFLGFQLLPH